MSNKIGGGYRSQSYLGTKADSPPNMIVEDRAPTIYDINYELGDLWEHKYIAGGVSAQDVYMLVNLEGTTTSKGELATWALLGSGSGDLTHLTGDDTVIVYPLGGNINVVGDGVNIFTRSTVANTLEVYYQGQPGEIFTTNSGSATPDPGTGILNIFGGTNMATRATGMPPSDTILIDMTPNIELTGWVYSHDILYSDLGVHVYGGGITVDAGGINATGPIVLPSLIGPGFLLADAAGAITVSTGAGSTGGWIPISNAAGAIVWGQLQPGSANITITNAGNVITIDSTAGGFGGLIADDTNTADPNGAQKVIVAGGTLIHTTSTVANTLTVSLVATGAAASPQVIYAPLAGGAGAWGRIAVAGGATIGEAGGVITITAGAGGAGFGGLIDAVGTTATPYANAKVTVTGGTLITTLANPAHTITVSIPNAPVAATPQLIYAPAAGGAGAWGRFAAAGGATVTEAGGVITINAGAGGAGGAVILHTNGADAAINAVDSSFSIVGGPLITTSSTVAHTVTVGLTQGTSGYVPIGTTGLAPVWGQILGGTDITVDVSVAGQITVNSTVVGGLITLTGNIGGPVTQDIAHNINLVGVANQIVSTGAFSTMALSLSPTLVLPGTLKIPVLNHVGIMMTDVTGLVSSLAPGVDGSVPTSNGAGVVTWNTIQQGPGSVTVTNVGGVITIGGGGGVSAGARWFDANVGAAEASVSTHPDPSIFIIGGENINTSAGTNTVVVNLNHSVILPVTTVDALSGVYGIGTNTTPSLPADRFMHSYGTNNTYCGHASGRLDITNIGHNNVGVGNNVLDAVISANDCTGVGSGCLGALDTGDNNVAVGNSSMLVATSSHDCVALGMNSQRALLTGNFNTSAGSYSLRNATTASDNCAFGYNALLTNVVGDDSVAIGSGALQLSTVGGNVAIGKSSMNAATTATESVAIGFESGIGITTGNRNTLFGNNSGHRLTTGNNNTIIGANAGYDPVSGGPTTGSDNILIGADAGSLIGIAVGYSNIYIGYKGTGIAQHQSNILHIGTDGVGAGQINACNIAGIYNRTTVPYNACHVVGVGSDGTLGKININPSGSNGYFIGNNTAGNFQWYQVVNPLDASTQITFNTLSTINYTFSTKTTPTAFSAIQIGDEWNITGDGSVWWLGQSVGTSSMSTASDGGFDTDGAFNPGGGANYAYFQAPRAGIYNFICQIWMSWLTNPVPPPPPPPVRLPANCPLYIQVINGKTYDLSYPIIVTNPSSQIAMFSAIIKLAANDRVRAGFSILSIPSARLIGSQGVTGAGAPPPGGDGLLIGSYFAGNIIRSWP